MVPAGAVVTVSGNDYGLLIGCNNNRFKYGRIHEGYQTTTNPGQRRDHKRNHLWNTTAYCKKGRSYTIIYPSIDYNSTFFVKSINRNVTAVAAQSRIEKRLFQWHRNDTLKYLDFVLHGSFLDSSIRIVMRERCKMLIETMLEKQRSFLDILKKEERGDLVGSI